jgi:hypothetical protein
MPSDCSVAEAVISPMMSFTLCTEATISRIMVPALATIFDPDSQLGQSLGDRQAQPGTAELVGDRGIGLFENLEQARNGLGRDPDARVFHREPHEQFIAAVFQQFGAQRDDAALRDLGRSWP